MGATGSSSVQSSSIKNTILNQIANECLTTVKNNIVSSV